LADTEGVVSAFGAAQERREAAVRLDRGDAIAAPGEDLVRIALVPHVPHDAVARRVVNEMQRDRQFDHAESGAEVAAHAGHRFDQVGAQLVRDARQIGFGNALQVVRRIDAGEQRVTCAVDHPRIVAQRASKRMRLRRLGRRQLHRRKSNVAAPMSGSPEHSGFSPTCGNAGP
jgi:hypothetical protein